MLMSEEYTSTSLSFISWLEVHRLNMACWQGINVIFLLLPCDSKYKYISSLRHFHWILESIYTRSLLYLVNQSTQIIVSWITYFPQIFDSSCEIMIHISVYFINMARLTGPRFPDYTHDKQGEYIIFLVFFLVVSERNRFVSLQISFTALHELYEFVVKSSSLTEVINWHVNNAGDGVSSLRRKVWDSASPRPQILHHASVPFGIFVDLSLAESSASLPPLFPVSLGIILHQWPKLHRDIPLCCPRFDLRGLLWIWVNVIFPQTLI